VSGSVDELLGYCESRSYAFLIVLKPRTLLESRTVKVFRLAYSQSPQTVPVDQLIEHLTTDLSTPTNAQGSVTDAAKNVSFISVTANGHTQAQSKANKQRGESKDVLVLQKRAMACIERLFLSSGVMWSNESAHTPPLIISVDLPYDRIRAVDSPHVRGNTAPAGRSRKLIHHCACLVLAGEHGSRRPGG
jgi:hypothetical protein